jgi:hypothetical protein
MSVVIPFPPSGEGGRTPARFALIPARFAVIGWRPSSTSDAGLVSVDDWRNCIQPDGVLAWPDGYHYLDGAVRPAWRAAEGPRAHLGDLGLLHAKLIIRDGLDPIAVRRELLKIAEFAAAMGPGEDRAFRLGAAQPDLGGVQ